MVRIGRVYTKTGDGGETSLIGGERVAKHHVRIEAVAGVDEANSALGVALAFLGDHDEALVSRLHQVQNDLFDVGADLGAPGGCGVEVPRVDGSYVARLEAWCDELNAPLPPLTSFVLPGGAPPTALVHVARAQCRRAERLAWRLRDETGDANVTAAVYLNRLSDLLFIVARTLDHDASGRETSEQWRPGAGREGESR